MSAKRILYIEDNFQNRRLVKKILMSQGYEVLEAEDGAEGIKVATRERPDLILMDINMAGMDGMEATAILKASSDLKHIPIIALTAAAMKGDKERIMASGCDDYMQKPLNKAMLLEAMQRYLSAAKPAPVATELSAQAS